MALGYGSGVPRMLPRMALVVAAMMAQLLIHVSSATVTAEIVEDVSSEEEYKSSPRSFLNEDEPLPPLFPLQWTDYLGFSVAIAGLVIAAGGGIGGGGILVPCYILLLDFPVGHAMPLASATILGGAIANMTLNWSKRHPDYPDVSCIDWDLILIMEPMTMAGALIGAYLNDFLPDIVLVLLLLILLGLTAHNTLEKANKMYTKETLAMQQNAVKTLETLPLNQGGPAVRDKVAYGSSMNDDEQAGVAPHLELTHGAPEEKETPSSQSSQLSQWQKKKILVDGAKLVALFVVTTIINLMKGGKGEGGGPFGLAQCGTFCFWISEFSILLLIGLFTIHVRSTLLSRLRQGRPVTSDISWNESNTVTYSLLAIIAGLVAGLFGIGGGIVKGPLMLALHVNPAVASATAATMIFFTASVSTASYSVFGLLVYDYAAFCFLLGLVSTFVGQVAMSQLMKTYNRKSYISYSMGIVVGLSAIAMSVEALFFVLIESNDEP
jgi:uncharacterized membrane protein YfcA